MEKIQQKLNNMFNYCKKNSEDVYFFIAILLLTLFITIKFNFIYCLPLFAAVCFLRAYILAGGGERG